MRIGPARLIARTAGMLMTLSPSQFERADQNSKWLQIVVDIQEEHKRRACSA